MQERQKKIKLKGDIQIDESMFTHDRNGFLTPTSSWEEDIYTDTQMLSGTELDDSNFQIEADESFSCRSDDDEFLLCENTPIEDKQYEDEESKEILPVGI